jgi:hypothetical protein
MGHLERCDPPTFIEGHHAMLKASTIRGSSWPDVKAAAVEIKPVRLVGLLAPCGIDDGDFESWQ